MIDSPARAAASSALQQWAPVASAMVPATDLMPDVPPVVPLAQQFRARVQQVTDWYHHWLATMADARDIRQEDKRSREQNNTTAWVHQLRVALQHVVDDADAHAEAEAKHSALRYGVAKSGVAPQTRAMLASDAHFEGHRPIRVAVLSAATTVGLSLLGTFGTPAATAAPVAPPEPPTHLTAVAYKPMHVQVLSAATTLRLQGHTATHALAADGFSSGGAAANLTPQKFPSGGGVAANLTPQKFPSIGGVARSAGVVLDASRQADMFDVTARLTAWPANDVPASYSEGAAA